MKYFLPKNLKTLNVSHNKLHVFSIKNKSHEIENVNVSHNSLTSFFMWKIPEKSIDVSNNDLLYFSYIRTHGKKPILDISNNTNFSNVLTFSANKFDTILRDNILNDKPFAYPEKRKKKGNGIIVD